jgi:hypothetical protein
MGINLGYRFSFFHYLAIFRSSWGEGFPGERQRYATNSDTQIAPKFVWANRADLHHNNALTF